MIFLYNKKLVRRALQKWESTNVTFLNCNYIFDIVEGNSFFY